MALVHDMAECIVGDLTPDDDISEAEKHQREQVGPTVYIAFHCLSWEMFPWVKMWINSPMATYREIDKYSKHHTTSNFVFVRMLGLFVLYSSSIFVHIHKKLIYT